MFLQGSDSRSNAWWSRRQGVPRRGWRLARCSSRWWGPDIEEGYNEVNVLILVFIKLRLLIAFLHADSITKVLNGREKKGVYFIPKEEFCFAREGRGQPELFVLL